MNGGGGGGGRGNKDVWKKYSHVNPEWKLRTGESFKSTFHQHRGKCPCRQGSTVPICVKSQICGGCFEGCHFDHEKIDRGTTIHSKFTTFVKGCRQGF